ncbi:integrin beta-2 isoform X1 [Oncorhynchus mykiss]|uniref:Integrin beta n=1 Tax=Oncorhynchus mykiss TaxID=8022 RepID=A0A8C7Q8Q9_ONCMY|nr:integrin beta-2 isoform X1 [Oncorhynchus mykiss]
MTLEMYPCVSLLLLLMGRGAIPLVLSQEGKVCSKTVINSCSDCIKSGAYCTWCKQLNFIKPGEQEAARCDTWAQLIERGCMEEDIISPKNDFSSSKNISLSNTALDKGEPIQLRPQEVNLKLRPGLPHTFTLDFQRVEGYPVDLYYLMDLSYSMEDDLRSIKTLGNELFNALQGITKKGRIGFGSFVDKTVLPFTNTNPEKLNKPCAETEMYCQPAFGYRHVLSMTEKKAEFESKVNKQRISGNLDSPEGTLDAIMQAAVCGERIGWRNSSTRLIVLTTDDGFHMAGDGKLAGILEPNDERCYMDNNLYSKSNEMDYPSVGQVANQLEKNNIQPIFAVTKNMEKVYRELSKMIPKSEVGVLSADSHNVVELIKNAYNRLSSKVTVTHDALPDNVRVTYTPLCPEGGPSGDKGVCNNVGVGQMVSFNVTVTADECMQSEISFLIGPLGMKDKLKVSLSTLCKCECENPVTVDSQYCNGKGQVNCGMCSCKAGFVGQKCECSIGEKDESSLRAACRKDNGTECEGRGDCVCGICQCYTLPGGSTYYGTNCECENESCEKFQNKLCGGNGKCRCKNCECKPGYEGTACQCKKSDEQCRTPSGSVCSGRGTCKCNQCKCMEGYQRPYCLTCPACQTTCITKGKCIECLGFQTGPFSKNCSQACTSISEFKMVETLPPGKPCDVRDVESCRVFFAIKQLDGEDNYTAQILKTRECPKLPNIYAIIGGSIVGVTVIGILILLFIKVLFTLQDLKEYRKFMNEAQKTRWSENKNPIFQEATTTVANPTFSGE